MKNILFKLLPHVTAVLLFVIVSSVYFSPVWDSYSLKQSDVKQYQGVAKEIADYRMLNGKEPLWTNAIFGGMPAYQISINHENNWMLKVGEMMRLGLPVPVGNLFVMLIGFYILALCMRINPWLGIVGALSFGFATFNILYLGAGHLTKINAVAYIAPSLGGLLLATRGKWMLGSVLFAFFFCLNLCSNHFQITYYTAIFLLVIAIAEGIRLVFEKQFKYLLIVSGSLIAAGILAVLPSMSNLLTTFEYSKYTTRGATDLTITADNQAREKSGLTGLNKDYILEYNFGKGEGLSIFIPNAKGGKADYIGNDEAAMEQADPEYAEQIGKSSHYWGGQKFSGGAIYFGAVAFFLFIIGLVFIKDSLKYPVIFLSIIVMGLAAKDGFLNDFFIDHIPMYNKFRDSKMILVLLQVMIPLIGMMFLDKAIKQEGLWGKQKIWLIGSGVIVFVGLILYVAPSISGSFIVADESKQFNEYVTQAKYQKVHALDQASKDQAESQITFISGLKSALIDSRMNIYRSDAGRTLLLFLISAGLILMFLYKKVGKSILIAGFALLISVDQISVCKRYLNNEEEGGVYTSYEEVSSNSIPYFPAVADYDILQKESRKNGKMKKDEEVLLDKMSNDPAYSESTASDILPQLAAFSALNLNSDYRVFSFDNPFNETVTSYFHKSIGGYHGAKLKRYQELIDFHISREIQVANRSISEGKMTKIRNYATQMEVTQEIAKAMFDTISLTGIELNDSCPILNMLNMKYLIVDRNKTPIYNPNANGNAWFVNKLVQATSSNEEMKKLGKLNTKNQALIGPEVKKLAKVNYAVDASAKIKLLQYGTNELKYKSKNKTAGFAVFSEIYYPDGWNCYIDGNQVAYNRVNYVLRGTEIPAGTHTIVWKFEPKSYLAGSSYSLLGSIALLLVFFSVGGIEVRKSLNQKEIV